MLDGTNRIVAMSLLACPHIVVQVVDYDDPDLILDTWHHVVTNMPVAEFFDALNGIAGLRVEPGNQLHARAELARRQATAYALLPEIGVYLLYVEGDIQRRTATLTRLVNLYQQRGRIHRVSTDHFEQLQTEGFLGFVLPN